MPLTSQGHVWTCAQCGEITPVPLRFKAAFAVGVNPPKSNAAPLATVTPASTGFEQMFTRFGALPPDERGPEAFARLARETGAIEVVGPPLARSHPR